MWKTTTLRHRTPPTMGTDASTQDSCRIRPTQRTGLGRERGGPRSWAGSAQAGPTGAPVAGRKAGETDASAPGNASGCRRPAFGGPGDARDHGVPGRKTSARPADLLGGSGPAPSGAGPETTGGDSDDPVHPPRPNPKRLFAEGPDRRAPPTGPRASSGRRSGNGSDAEGGTRKGSTGEQEPPGTSARKSMDASRPSWEGASPVDATGAARHRDGTLKRHSCRGRTRLDEGRTPDRWSVKTGRGKPRRRPAPSLRFPLHPLHASRVQWVLGRETRTLERARRVFALPLT